MWARDVHKRELVVPDADHVWQQPLHVHWDIFRRVSNVQQWRKLHLVVGVHVDGVLDKPGWKSGMVSSPAARRWLLRARSVHSCQASSLCCKTSELLHGMPPRHVHGPKWCVCMCNLSCWDVHAKHWGDSVHTLLSLRSCHCRSGFVQQLSRWPIRRPSGFTVPHVFSWHVSTYTTDHLGPVPSLGWMRENVDHILWR